MQNFLSVWAQTYGFPSSANCFSLPSLMPLDRLQLSPRFQGRRFEHHCIPVELLPDLAAYRDLIRDVAKHLYKQAHPEKKRVPSGFESTFRLALSEVREGSAVPILVPQIEDDEAEKVGEFIDFFEAAKGIVDETMRSAGNPDGALPANFPTKLLPKFNSIGRGLKEGDVIDFAFGTAAAANFTPKVRKTLSLWATDQFEADVDVVGQVTGINRDPIDKFDVKLEDGRKVSGPIPAEMSDEVFAACKNPRSCLRIKGTGLFDRANRLQEISEVREIETLDGQALELYRALRRVKEMKSLPVGWCDGRGAPFSAEAVAWLENLLTALVDDHLLPTPSVFPTPEGELQMEWNWPEGSVDVRVNPTTHAAFIMAFTKEGDVEAENLLDTKERVEGFAHDLNKLIPIDGA